MFKVNDPIENWKPFVKPNLPVFSKELYQRIEETETNTTVKYEAPYCNYRKLVVEAEDVEDLGQRLNALPKNLVTNGGMLDFITDTKEKKMSVSQTPENKRPNLLNNYLAEDQH